MIGRRWRVDCIVGARPNFVKIAPIMRALRADARFSARLLHTGQHYDPAMNDVFFEELQIPEPELNLAVGSGSGTEQTARMMLGVEKFLLSDRPDAIIVVGDANPSFAAALVAAKLLIPVVHVEAGLRSGDRTMPEEINRMITDHLSDLLLTTERSARQNLIREGIADERICFVGNVMIDSLHFGLQNAVPATQTLREYGWSLTDSALRPGFGFVTLHRPSNVDDPEKFARLLQALSRISERIPLFFPAHPRTRAIIDQLTTNPLSRSSTLLITPPIAYFKAIGLMREARLVITDSGGVQEETTALGVPCLTFRNTTERPITVEEGTNTVVGADAAALERAAAAALAVRSKSGRVPELWDGKAAPRILQALESFLCGTPRRYCDAAR